VFLITGTPDPDPWAGYPDVPLRGPSVIGFAPRLGVMSARFAECPFCGRVSLMRLIGGLWQAICPCRGDEPFEDTRYNPYEWSPRIKRAMAKACAARFEHGEVPSP
jgi:ribosomal protein L37AE/L43A